MYTPFILMINLMVIEDLNYKIIILTYYFLLSNRGLIREF